MARKTAPDLRQYNGVIDVAVTHGWACSLDYRRGVFTLDVHEGGELIARGRSGLCAPLGIVDAARKTRVSLERSGRIR